MVDTLRINGKQVQADREDQNFSRDALATEMRTRGLGSLSVSTIRRAEAGAATRSSITKIARVLGFPAQRYLMKSSNGDSLPAVDVSGKWYVFYLEADKDDNPIVASEELFIKQNGHEISGIYRQLKGFRKDADDDAFCFQMVGYLCGDIIIGLYFIELPSPEGTGGFQLKLHSLTRAEGICLFTDGEKGSDVWFSRCIWIHSMAENLTRERNLARKSVLVPPRSVGSSKQA